MNNPGRIRKFQYWPFFLFFISLAVIYLVLSVLEVFGKWESLNPPPTGVDSLVNFRFGDLSPYLIVADADGTQFVCASMDGNRCKEWWSPVKNYYEHSEEYRCNFKHFRFTLGYHPFDRVVDCMEDRYTAGGYGTERYVVVLDDRHQLWLWNNGVVESYDWVGVLAIYILLSFVASYVTALIWNSLGIWLFPGPVERRAENRKAYLTWLERALRVGAQVGSVVGLLASIYLLYDSLYPPPVDNFRVLLRNPEDLFRVAISLCTLVAWRKPLAGSIAGIFCVFLSFLKVDVDYIIFLSTWFALVFLGFIGSSICRTQRGRTEEMQRISWLKPMMTFFSGLVLAIMLALITQSGLIGYWVLLDPPPEKVGELVTISGLEGYGPDLIINDQGGNQMECPTYAYDCMEWRPKSEEISAARQNEKYSCNFHHPRFTVMVRPFNHVEDCLEAQYNGDFGTDRVIFVLDDRGNLWKGSFDENEAKILERFLSLLPVGWLMSISTALVWNQLALRAGRNRKKKE